MPKSLRAQTAFSLEDPIPKFLPARRIFAPLNL
jgi:hypothetical protein